MLNQPNLPVYMMVYKHLFVLISFSVVACIEPHKFSSNLPMSHIFDSTLKFSAVSYYYISS